MATLQDLTTVNQGEMIDKAVAAKQGELQDMCVKAWMAATEDFSKWEKTNLDKPVPERLAKLNENLCKEYMKATIDAFNSGFIAGLDTAFDIVEAKAMELGKVSKESLN